MRQPLPCALRSSALSATLARVGHATDIKPRLLDPGLCLSFHLSLLFTGYEASPRSCLTLSAFPEQSHSKEYLLTVRNFVQVTASLLDGKDSQRVLRVRRRIRDLSLLAAPPPPHHQTAHSEPGCREAPYSCMSTPEHGRQPSSHKHAHTNSKRARTHTHKTRLWLMANKTTCAQLTPEFAREEPVGSVDADRTEVSTGRCTCSSPRAALPGVLAPGPVFELLL